MNTIFVILRKHYVPFVGGGGLGGAFSSEMGVGVLFLVLLLVLFLYGFG